MRRYSLNSSTINAFGAAPQSSGLTIHTTGSAQARGRSVDRGRRPTVTLADLEDSTPFENLKNIDKPRTGGKNDNGAAGSTTPSTRPGLHSTGRDDFRHGTPQPMTSLVHEKTDVRRISPEPTHRWPPMTSSLPEKSEVRHNLPDPTRQLLTSLLPDKTDVRRTSPEPAYRWPPMTSLLPEKTDFGRTTQEVMTSSARVYADGKRHPQESTASSVLGCTDIKTSTQEKATPSTCVYTGPTPVTGNGTFFLGT